MTERAYRRRHYALVAVAAVALLLGVRACQAPSAADFREQDSDGYQACLHFDNADGAGGSVYRDEIKAAAKYATTAETTEISNLAAPRSPLGRPVIENLGDFQNACDEAGYDF